MAISQPPKPLNARVVALELLAPVLKKRQTLEDAQRQVPAFAQLKSEDAGFANLLAMTALRRFGQCEALLEALLEFPLAPKMFHVKHALVLGLVQLLWLNTPPHAAVSETVEAVRKLRFEKMTGLVNATLKRVANDIDGWRAKADGAIMRNAPAWMIQSWVQAYGEEKTKTLLAQAQVIPPLDLQFVDADDAKDWAAENDGECLPHGAVRVSGAGLVSRLPGFDAGKWWVQDAAASVPAMLLGDVVGKRVLDVCAAPGGKTAQLIARGAHVTAIDISANRLKRLKDNLARLKMDAEVLAKDALAYAPEEKFDAVLLDAPCSATGTLRRHPELLWQREESDVQRLADLQARLLHKASDWLNAGSTLIYAVCSLQPEEGKIQVEEFLRTHAQWKRAPLTREEFAWMPHEWLTAEGDFQCLPAPEPFEGGADGFYAARLVCQG